MQERRYFRRFQRYLDQLLYRFVFAVTQRNFPDHEMKEECANLICPPVLRSIRVVLIKLTLI